MEWPLLIAVAILSIMWAISTYKWVRAEQEAQRYFNTMIRMWKENTRLNKQLSHYQKDESEFDTLEWLDKYEYEEVK